MKRLVLFVVALVFAFCTTVMAADKPVTPPAAPPVEKAEPVKKEEVKKVKKVKKMKKVKKEKKVEEKKVEEATPAK